jgi:hypothetical protein
MAKISTYSTDALISTDDKLIGTDAENSNATKNFLVGDLLDFINENLTNIGVPYVGATQNVDLGTYNLLADYIEGSEIYSPDTSGDVLSAWDELRVDAGATISLNGDVGEDGYVMKSKGAGTNPVWISPGDFFESAVLTLPTYASNAEALAGGLIQGQLYKSAAGVVSIVL